jgi:hypothetical protein
MTAPLWPIRGRLNTHKKDKAPHWSTDANGEKDVAKPESEKEAHAATRAELGLPAGNHVVECVADA